MGYAAVKWSVLALVCIWIGWAGWYEFVREEPYEFQAQSPEAAFAKAMKECKGAYSERYECKSALIRERDSSVFFYWANKLVFLFVPAIVVGGIFGGYARVRYKRQHAELKEKTLKRREEIRAVENEEAEKEARKREARALRRKTMNERKQMISRANKKAQINQKPRPKHFMVIDNDGETVDVIELTLETEGHHVLHSSTARDGLIGLGDLAYDMFMVNVLLKGGTGLEAIKTIAEEAPNIAVVALAENMEGMPASATLAAAEKIGATGGIEKPVNPENLLQVVTVILSGDDGGGDKEAVATYRKARFPSSY